MGLISTFVDAFKKGIEKKPKSDAELKELARSSGGSLGAAPASAGGSFDPIERPTPESETTGHDPGDVSASVDMSLGSGDSEGGGERPGTSPSPSA